MKISQNLPQLRTDDLLIIVAGRQNAIFYEIRGGEISPIDEFKIPKPHYSDNEGHFRSHSHGKLISSGSVREIEKRDIMREFLTELKKRIKQVRPDDFARLYIFVPAEIKRDLRRTLPVEWRRKLDGLIEGNFFYHHPSTILDRLEGEINIDIS